MLVSNFCHTVSMAANVYEQRKLRSWHVCDKDTSHFCMVCAKFAPVGGRINVSKLAQEAYVICWNDVPLLTDVSYAPDSICLTCYNSMLAVKRDREAAIAENRKPNKTPRFVTPAIWLQPKAEKDCYFCVNDIHGFNRIKSKVTNFTPTSSVQMPIKFVRRMHAHFADEDADDALDLLAHLAFEDAVAPTARSASDGAICDSIDCATKPKWCTAPSSFESSSDSSTASSGDENPDPLDKTYIPGSSSGSERVQPQTLNQRQLNDLVRVLRLSKEAAEMLGSRLDQFGVLMPGVVTTFRNRNDLFTACFATEVVRGSTKRGSLTGTLAYCVDATRLLAMYNVQHNPDDWRLFVDSSKRSIKAVLLHNGNILPSIPLAYSTQLTETYENIQLVLERLQYQKYKWLFVADLKVLAMVMGLRSGYVKYCCPLCSWDSRYKGNHYTNYGWLRREHHEIGQLSVENEPLIPKDRVLMPPLHIKLGLFKNFVKALEKDSAAFEFLANMFPAISEGKIREGIFVGPNIRSLMKTKNSVKFMETLKSHEQMAWLSLKNVCEKFLGNERDEEAQKIVQNMLDAFQVMGVNMSLKVHLMHFHLADFPPLFRLGEVSDEQGEQFHQLISWTESRFNGKWTPSLLGDYCWLLQRESRKVYRKTDQHPHFQPPAKKN